MHEGPPPDENTEHRWPRAGGCRIAQCALSRADLRAVAGEPDVGLAALQPRNYGQICGRDLREASTEARLAPFLPEWSGERGFHIMVVGKLFRRQLRRERSRNPADARLVSGRNRRIA